MPKYGIINMPNGIKWARVDGFFYVDGKYLDKFLIKFNKYKKERTA